MAGEKTPRQILDELAVDDSDARKKLHDKDKDDVIAVLEGWGIEIKDRSLIPDKVKLPAAKKVEKYIQLAEAYDLLGEPQELAYAPDYLILMCVVGAIPFVAADLYGSG
jgi:hypothetical protein